MLTRYRQTPSRCSLITYKVQHSAQSDILLFQTYALHTCRHTRPSSLAPPPHLYRAFASERIAGDIYRPDGSIYRSEELGEEKQTRWEVASLISISRLTGLRRP